MSEQRSLSFISAATLDHVLEVCPPLVTIPLNPDEAVDGLAWAFEESQKWRLYYRQQTERLGDEVRRLRAIIGPEDDGTEDAS